ncbi:helix-turn-helix domain-containing protein [Allomuricauda sp. F6463D]|uniref:helix-turn-helix domain-containing protein n=1 Tax=Allomuricauda sp. F6463D TaxID=2926409 RepID=UPI001FF1B3AE|nr:AraC family transcriptional regulator [Muricauda sp. F6463D]MCK0159179.1 AraC family transcriptional regulator [Muricauda sp. F6463D]
MKTIPLKTEKMNEVFNNFQKVFGGNLSMDAKEYILKLDGTLGKGLIKGITFKGGISYMEFDVEFSENLELVANSPKHTPICFAYCSQGQVTHSFGRNGEQQLLENFQTGILTSKTNQDNVLFFEKNVRLKMMFVMVLPVKRAESTTHLNKELQKLFFKNNVADNFAYVGSYNLKVADRVRQLNTIKEKGIARRLMIEGLVHLILALEIQQHSDDINKSELTESSLTSKEQEVIREMSLFINNYYEKNLSISYLCKKSGLSPSKLQEGFKLMHGTTVTDYIRDVRVKKAEDLIKNTDMNISEVVYSIGFISRSYFSKIFKAKYNCSPKEYKDKQKTFAVSA